MEEIPWKPKKIVARRSSILKKPTDGDTSDCTETTKNKLIRRISFCGKKSVKEFMQDEEKNTVWGTSYEESAESGRLNISNNAPRCGNCDLTDMDIELEPAGAVCPIANINKENETPDRTMWSTINIASKPPLASSTMLDMQLEPSPNNKSLGLDWGASARNVPPNCEDFAIEKTKQMPQNPFSWLSDPKIVGRHALEAIESPESPKVAAKNLNRTEFETTTDQSTFFTTIPPESLMDSLSLCNFDISSLYIEPEEKQRLVERQKKIKQKLRLGKKVEITPPMGDDMDIEEEFNKQKNMEMTFMEKKQQKEEKIRKTIYFPTDADQMNLTGAASRDAAAERSRKQPHFPTEINKMDLTGSSGNTVSDKSMDITTFPESAKENKEVRKTIFFASKNLDFTGEGENLKAQQSAMEMTFERNAEEKKTGRRTVFFNEDQINITTDEEKIPQRNTEGMNITRNLPGMDITLKEHSKAHCERKTIYFPGAENKLDITDGVAEKRYSFSCLDMTLSPKEPPKDHKVARKTIHFAREDENQMNLTGVTQTESKNEPQKALETKMDITCYPIEVEDDVQEENNSMNISVQVEECEKVGNFGRRTIHFSPKSKQMDIEESPLPVQSKSAEKESRKTINFTADNQMNLSVSADKNRETKLPNMEISVHAVEFAKSRRTVHFSAGDTQMDITGKKSLTPKMDVTFLPEGSTCGQVKSRKTVFFPDEDNQMNLTETPREIEKKISEAKPPNSGSDMDLESPKLSAHNPQRKTVFCYEDIAEDANVLVAEEKNPEEDLQGATHEEMEISMIEEKKLPETEVKRKTIFFEEHNRVSLDRTVAIIPPRRESIVEKTLNESVQIEVYSRDQTMCSQATSLNCTSLANQSDYSTLKLTECQLPSISFKELSELNDDVGDIKMLSEESSIEMESSNLSLKMNLENTFSRLGEIMVAQEENVQVRNLRRETFVIHKNSEVKSQIPIRVSSQKSAQPPESSCRSFLPSEIPKEHEVTLSSNETLESIADTSTSSNVPSATSISLCGKINQRGPPRKSIANDPKFLENLFGSEKFREICAAKVAEKESRESMIRCLEKYKEIKLLLEYYQKYPSRCQYPKSLSFKDLIENMVNNSLRSIWFIDVYFGQGAMMFKHRKITTFEIHIFFDPKELKNMDCVHNRGILTFNRIKVTDCQDYTEKDPATRSKVWTYLHTKFRSQVLMDQYLLNKYSDSNSLRDFLEYIDKLCCDIYAARPSILEIVKMFR